VCVCVTEDSQETATWASLIAIGGVVCLAIVVIVVVLIKRTADYRKQASHYHQLTRYIDTTCSSIVVQEGQSKASHYHQLTRYIDTTSHYLQLTR